LKKKWIDPKADQLTKAKYQEIADKQALDLVNSFSKDFPEVMSLIQLEQ